MAETMLRLLSVCLVVAAAVVDAAEPKRCSLDIPCRNGTCEARFRLSTRIPHSHTQCVGSACIFPGGITTPQRRPTAPLRRRRAFPLCSSPTPPSLLRQIHTGTCSCPLYYGGPLCEDPVYPACRLTADWRCDLPPVMWCNPWAEPRNCECIRQCYASPNVLRIPPDRRAAERDTRISPCRLGRSYRQASELEDYRRQGSHIQAQCSSDFPPTWRAHRCCRAFPCFEREGVPPERQLSAIPSADELGVRYWSNFQEFLGQNQAGPVVPARCSTFSAPLSSSLLILFLHPAAASRPPLPLAAKAAAGRGSAAAVACSSHSQRGSPHFLRLRPWTTSAEYPRIRRCRPTGPQ